ncbi:hypothetical protein QBC47DRAFT_157086 [Echria macrotheca]|uniref:Uncharacterized protein n=1 Tax=Echria macrotheca TaxID=438768 RepID=A0AAJ0BFU5_9PEZI|nr:hypothetical protein QBC47DRAFT_157086 [Echria macrotheca]
MQLIYSATSHFGFSHALRLPARSNRERTTWIACCCQPKRWIPGAWAASRCRSCVPWYVRKDSHRPALGVGGFLVSEGGVLGRMTYMLQGPWHGNLPSWWAWGGESTSQRRAEREGRRQSNRCTSGKQGVSRLGSCNDSCKSNNSERALPVGGGTGSGGGVSWGVQIVEAMELEGWKPTAKVSVRLAHHSCWMPGKGYACPFWWMTERKAAWWLPPGRPATRPCACPGPWCVDCKPGPAHDLGHHQRCGGDALSGGLLPQICLESFPRTLTPSSLAQGLSQPSTVRSLHGP